MTSLQKLYTRFNSIILKRCVILYADNENYIMLSQNSKIQDFEQSDNVIESVE